MIVKVQQSQYNSAGQSMMLVYNEDRSIIGEYYLTEEVSKALKGRSKAYFEGEINDKNEFDLLKEVETQDW